MSLTIETATGGTPYELQNGAGRAFSVTEGGIFAFPQTRGENIIVPGATGQAPVPWVGDSMLVKIHGSIVGVGATIALRRASFREQKEDLNTQLVLPGTLVTITQYGSADGENEGLVEGETAIITAQFLRTVELPIIGWESQVLTIECQCVSNPLGWTIDESP